MVRLMKEREILLGLGAKIRQFRKEVGLSQAELGDKVGVTLENIGRIERGLHFVSAANLGRIATAVGRNIDELFSATPRVRKKPEQAAIDQSVGQYRELLERGEPIEVEDVVRLLDTAAKTKKTTRKR